jgi:hypothetical protein
MESLWDRNCIKAISRYWAPGFLASFRQSFDQILLVHIAPGYSTHSLRGIGDGKKRTDVKFSTIKGTFL